MEEIEDFRSFWGECILGILIAVCIILYCISGGIYNA